MSASPTSRSRRPAGTPTGGQFAPDAHAEPEVALGTTGTTPPDQPSEARREVDADGTIRWYDDAGDLHRDGGPAIEYANGARTWRQHGQLHRDGGPAVEYANGSTEWYQHGQLHRDGGPAVEYADGFTFWYQHGQLHRDDGPAAEYADGRKEWWLDGDQLSEAEVAVRGLTTISGDTWARAGATMGAGDARRLANLLAAAGQPDAADAVLAAAESSGSGDGPSGSGSRAGGTAGSGR